MQQVGLLGSHLELAILFIAGFLGVSITFYALRFLFRFYMNLKIMNEEKFKGKLSTWTFLKYHRAHNGK